MRYRHEAYGYGRGTAKPGDLPHMLAVRGGLYLLFNPMGSNLWRLDRRFAGRWSRWPLTHSGREGDTFTSRSSRVHTNVWDFSSRKNTVRSLAGKAAGTW